MQSRFQVARSLALQAGALLREGLTHSKDINHKGAIDLVTQYDLLSEALIVDGLRHAFPQDSVLAEEGGGDQSSRGTWLVDPLDGTTNFAHGIPFFAISIAYQQGEDIQLALVYDPMRQELFHARRGQGAWLNERRLHVSSTVDLGEALLATGFPYDMRTHPENNLKHFAAFALRSRGIRRLGAASLDLAYVAAGRFDGYWELRLWPWDWAAGILLVREAGGMVTRADGGEDIFAQPTSILASNGLLHEAMLRVLAGREPQPSQG
jgi:myo-inositol-1(or 4)-monophosphatase